MRSTVLTLAWSKSSRVGMSRVRHSSDRQSHRRQLKVAQAVTGSGVPLYHRVVLGARHEGAETHQLLERLRGLAAPRRLLLVADSALVTNDNLAACERAHMQFIARLPRSYGYEETALALEPGSFTKLTYCSDRGRRLPLSKRPTFKGAEGHLNIRVDGENLKLRVLYVIGSEERQAAQNSRARLLARAEQSLERIAQGILGAPPKIPRNSSVAWPRLSPPAVSATSCGPN